MAPKTKNIATMEHAVLIRTACESIKGNYAPGADRIIAEVQKTRPEFPLERDAVKRIISGIKVGRTPAEITGACGKGSGKGGRGKGADKQKKDRDRRLPKELIGFSSSYNGKPVCFAYNLDGCNQTVNGVNECGKGLHVCMRCGGNHSQRYRQCPKL